MGTVKYVITSRPYKEGTTIVLKDVPYLVVSCIGKFNIYRLKLRSV